MKQRLVSMATAAAALGAFSAPAPARVPVPHLYVSPTAGVFRWDEKATEFGDLDGTFGEALGVRVGYAPVAAFSGELVFLTGANQGTDGTGAEAVPFSVRTTQIEASFLVNFQTLIGSRIYPFLNLGAGISLRRGDLIREGEDVLDGEEPAFHLGGGLRGDLGDRLGLRVNLRNTFFNQTRGEGDREDRVTVDTVEITAALDLRIPLSGRHPKGERLR